jgi:Zn-dependent peptidase ImmA (M78 family)
MSTHVPCLPEEAIERDAAALLAEFEHARGIVLEPPIPVEDIVEKHLKLRIEFDDLHARHNIPRLEGGQTDILGAIYGDGSIFIDETLDPDENPSREGRYRFTVAHECGHWRLHQRLIKTDMVQGSLFLDNRAPKFICRSSEAKERVEWQADFYSSCMTMPRKLVFDAWQGRFGNTNPLARKKPRAEELSSLDPAAHAAFIKASRPFDDQFMESFAAPLAEKFVVSRQAMRIRLEKIGLLRRGWPSRHSRMMN